MKVLTVCQPWAWALVSGPKRVENRPWITHHRGLLLIHAGKSQSYMDSFDWDDPEPPMLDSTPLPRRASLAMGALVGAVQLMDVIDVAEAWNRRLSFADGPYCWVTAQPVAFRRPIPLSGKQGLWNLPAHLEPAVRAMLTEGGTS